MENKPASGKRGESWILKRKIVEVPAKRVPHFKPGKELKAMVEGG